MYWISTNKFLLNFKQQTRASSRLFSSPVQSLWVLSGSPINPTNGHRPQRWFGVGWVSAAVLNWQNLSTNHLHFPSHQLRDQRGASKLSKTEFKKLKKLKIKNGRQPTRVKTSCHILPVPPRTLSFPLASSIMSALLLLEGFCFRDASPSPEFSSSSSIFSSCIPAAVLSSSGTANVSPSHVLLSYQLPCRVHLFAIFDSVRLVSWAILDLPPFGFRVLLD